MTSCITMPWPSQEHVDALGAQLAKRGCRRVEGGVRPEKLGAQGFEIYARMKKPGLPGFLCGGPSHFIGVRLCFWGAQRSWICAQGFGTCG
jgi:hypothetical protein